MKRLFIISFLIISFHSYAQPKKNDVEAVIAGFFNGLSLLDADTLKHFTTSDFQLLEDGEVWNMDTLLNKVMPMKNAGIKRENKFEFITTEFNGNMAWTSYRNTAEFSIGDKKQTIRWLESAVLSRIKGQWKIQMLHSTVIK